MNINTTFSHKQFHPEQDADAVSLHVDAIIGYMGRIRRDFGKDIQIELETTVKINPLGAGVEVPLMEELEGLKIT